MVFSLFQQQQHENLFMMVYLVLMVLVVICPQQLILGLFQQLCVILKQTLPGQLITFEKTQQPNKRQLRRITRVFQRYLKVHYGRKTDLHIWKILTCCMRFSYHSFFASFFVVVGIGNSIQFLTISRINTDISISKCAGHCYPIIVPLV